MSTNYYLNIRACPTCKRSDEILHIGKSSAGWCFALHVHGGEGIHTLGDWVGRFDESDNVIRDEYGNIVKPQDMIAIICERSRPEVDWVKPPAYRYKSWEEFHRANHSERGPNGMVRSQIDGQHCVGHGDGTYDYMIGEFS